MCALVWLKLSDPVVDWAVVRLVLSQINGSETVAYNCASLWIMLLYDLRHLQDTHHLDGGITVTT